MKVIAISGWKGSGKDTIAAHLIEKYGAKRTAFADPLKDLAAEEYGFPRSHADDPQFKEAPILTMPVDPRDKFTRMVANFMIKEFRTSNGKQTTIDQAYTIDQAAMETLYWTPRALCILKGSVNRTVDPAFWVKQAIKKIKTSEAELNVISDLRYMSEVEQLKEAFGKDLITLRVDRFDSSPSQDPSERDLDQWQTFDYFINNRGTIEETLYIVDVILEGKI